jgi:hypothetical protein
LPGGPAQLFQYCLQLSPSPSPRMLLSASPSTVAYICLINECTKE